MLLKNANFLGAPLLVKVFRQLSKWPSDSVNT